MVVIGITGGVGCGKSRVLAYLEEQHHMRVIQADLVSHELITSEGKCFRPIVDLLGDTILGADGEIDKKKMAAAIFSDASLREKVNGIIHPQVKEEIRHRVLKAREEGFSYTVVEAALLPEAHYEEFIDTYWYIHASEEVRRERLKTSRGYTDEKIDSIIRSQKSEQEFRECCDVTIENDGAFAETAKQIEEILSDVNTARS